MYKMYFLFFYLLIFSCKESVEKVEPPSFISSTRAKFEPVNGKCLVLVDGDESGASDYSTHFNYPIGISVSTRLLDDYTSLKEKIDRYKVVSIGLNFGGQEELVFRGDYDKKIEALASFFLTMPDKVIFLRLGYEFDDFVKYKYSRQPFLLAYKHIHVLLDQLAVKHVAYVWQSSGLGSYAELLDEWYPGDRWVDWVGFSFYDPRNVNHPMLAFARQKKKPLLIGNAAPIYLDPQSIRRPIDMTNLDRDMDIWSNWYTPFFNLLHTHGDVIKGYSYHNGPWGARPIWGDDFGPLNGTISVQHQIGKKWNKKVKDEKFSMTNIDLRN